MPLTTSYNILALLLLVQFLIYLDRGIIPGSYNNLETPDEKIAEILFNGNFRSVKEINAFITTTVKTSRPDVFLGILQSSFVIGLSISCPMIGYFSHKSSPYSLISIGIGIWVAGAWLAGLSHQIQRYSVLLIGRILSGVGEAALISLVPPLIMSKVEGPAVGLWMGAFCAMIPIGTAVGYCYGSLLADSVEGWGTAFILEAVVGVPLVLTFLGISTMSSDRVATGLASESQREIVGPDLVLRREDCPVNGNIPKVKSPSRRLYQLSEQKFLAEASSDSRTHKPLENIFLEPNHTNDYPIETPHSIRPEEYSPPCSVTFEGRLTAISPAKRYVSFTKGTTGCLSFHSDDEDDTNDASREPSIEGQITEATIDSDSLTNNPHRHISFFEDFKTVVSSPSFVWLSVTYSAYSATVIAFSTFGSAFLVDLGLLNNATLASLCMGATVAISGILGGLAGGGLASVASEKSKDKLQHLESSRIPVQECDYTTDDTWPEAVDSTRHSEVLSPLREADPLDISSKSLSAKDDQNLFDKQRLIELSSLLDTMLPVLIVSISILCLASFVRTLPTFLVSIGVGLSGLFATQAGLNIATMLSVPESQRACSIAMITLILHLTGDVPSPIVTGLLKDLLAPDCGSTNPPLDLGFLHLSSWKSLNKTSTDTSFLPQSDVHIQSSVLRTTTATALDFFRTTLSAPLFEYNYGRRSFLQSNNLQLLAEKQPNVFQSSAGASFILAIQRRLSEILSTPSATCHDESVGIRLTIFITTIWLSWMVIGVIKAKKAAFAQLEMLQNLSTTESAAKNLATISP